MELVGVVLNCSDWFDEAARLMDACFETYTMARVLGPTMAAGKIAVDRRHGRRARGSARCRISACRSCEGESAQVVLDVPQAVRAPGYAGQHIGTAQVVVGGKALACVRDRAERICGKQTAGAGCAAGRFTMDVIRRSIE